LALRVWVAVLVFACTGQLYIPSAARPLNDPAPMTLPVEQTWGRPGTLKDHFERHGADFDAISPADYAQQASAFLQRSQQQGLPTKITPGGVIRTYDQISNTFGAYNAKGTTRTFFSPPE